MGQSNDARMVVLVAGYGSLAAAVEGFDAVRGAFEAGDAESLQDCDAAVIDPRQSDLRSRVVREMPRRRQAGGPDDEGLATRLAHYLGEGLALVGGAAGGGGQDVLEGADAGGTPGPLDPGELKELAAVQEASPAVLIAIFPTAMSEDIVAATKAAERRASRQIDAGSEEIAAQIATAERESISEGRP